ncbi:HK97 family phage prohead protease [Rhodovulum sp. DZ06]|uniref:HK97 family phage prohead protease n=1 Tax=Rhodovulum sp. DZ06 TaxID=3425126 RepID=UPI003D32E98F
MIEIERRAAAELRAAGNRLTGYAAVFNARSHDLGGFVETIRPGAFTRTLAAGADVVALYHHDARHVLGRTLSGTLRLAEDARGLRFDLDVADTSAGRDVLESVGRGDVTGASFAFRSRKDEWSRDARPAVRTLIDVDLLDVTITPTPAYPDASVARRALDAQRAAPLALRRRRLDLARRRIGA